MNIEEIKNKIIKTNWAKYNGPDIYKSDEVADALLTLVDVNDPNLGYEFCHLVITSIGNDHGGTYYPAVLSALDIIISIDKASDDNKVRRGWARAILNTLYYFQPELGSYSNCTEKELKDFVCNKLEPYSDGKEMWRGTNH